MPIENEIDVPTVDVVAVGAHPDDVEVACGGTLAKLAGDGYSVAIIDLTDGEPTPHCPDRATRMRESDDAAAALGVAIRVQLGLPNRALFDGFENRIKLARWLRRLRPSVVIGFGEKTPMASPDHWQAAQLTDAAIFYSRLSKWPEHFDSLATHGIARHLYFRMPLEPELMPGHSHHFNVDITTTIDAKIASVMAYKTQFEHKPFFADRIRSAAITTGSLSGCRFAETLAAAKPRAVDDVMGFLGLR